MPTPSSLLQALEPLWRIPPSGPENLFSYPPFSKLCDICSELYPPAESTDALSIAVHTALRALGIPYSLRSAKQAIGLTVAEAAARLDQAFRQKTVSRVHLCPLDYGDELPGLEFGPAVVRRFSASELEDLMDVRRLLRTYPTWEFDGGNLAQFAWLVVREAIAVDGEAGKRAAPFFYTSISDDYAAIEPHRRRFPAAVEFALFPLLLAPWEEWVDNIEVDWRAFRIPWVYTTDDDLFRAHAAPPRSDTLSWKPCAYKDGSGQEIVGECPDYFPLNDRTKEVASWVNHPRWTVLEKARTANLFSEPIEHFVNRAFLSDGIDEFLAHITAIEAGLGTSLDHDIHNRPRLNRRNPGATERVALRLGKLLGDSTATEAYRRLFKTRSDFLHGRRLTSIPGKDRILARQLARRVSDRLVVEAANAPALPRESFLAGLL